MGCEFDAHRCSGSKGVEEDKKVISLRSKRGFSRFVGRRSECCLCHPLGVEAPALQAQRGCENHILPVPPLLSEKASACQGWRGGGAAARTQCMYSSVVFPSKEKIS